MSVPQAVRDVVLERDEQQCRRCWRSIVGRPYSIHHRKLRSRGGDDSLPNLVTLCGSGTTGCHGWVHANPEKATTHGWMVESWRKPDEAPIIYPEETSGTRYVFFLTDQGWEVG